MNDMIVNKFKKIDVIGIASAVSSHWQSLEEAVISNNIEPDFNIDKFKKNTGVLGRYVANDYQTTSDFCYYAACELINKNKIPLDKIGIVVLVTQMPDYDQPATACVLHKRLGLSQNCIAFDVNQGCSGYVYGLNIVSSLLENSDSEYALLLCGDTSAKNKYRGKKENRNSHSTLLLFGDGGSATLLKKGSDSLTITSCTDGNDFDAIIMSQDTWRHPLSTRSHYLDDIRVFNFSIDKAPSMLCAYMKVQGTSPEDYDGLVLHQANKFIIQTVGKRAGFPKEKILSSIERFANTSSASIPNTLVNEYGENDSEEKLRFLCCGFGVGLSWAAVELNIAPSQILPLVHTDEWFDDGLPEK